MQGQFVWSFFVSVNISYVECCHHHHPRMYLPRTPRTNLPAPYPRMDPLSPPPYVLFFSRTLPPPSAFGSSCCASVPLFCNTHTRSHKCSPLCVVYFNNQLAEIKLCCGSIDTGSSGFLCSYFEAKALSALYNTENSRLCYE